MTLQELEDKLRKSKERKKVNNEEILKELRDIQSSLVNYDFLQSSNNNQGRIRGVITKISQLINALKNAE